MGLKQEFLVLEADGDVAVYAPSQFPIGTPIGRDARRLGVSGPAFARPPKVRLTGPEFERWRQQLEGEGYTVTLGPFWINPVRPEDADEAIRQGKVVPLQEAFDELLREAEGRGQSEDRRLEAVQPRHP
jgi:hypothetical protein